MNLSDYGALQYSQMIVGLVSPPTTMYVALTYSEPTPSGLGTDLDEPVDATGYLRKSIASTDWALVDSVTPAVANTPGFSWTPAVDWNTINFVVLCTSVGTNQVWAWTQVDPLTPLTGSTYTVDVSTMVLSVSGPSEQVDV